MGLFMKLFKHLVYLLTDKPEEYVHVDKPKTLQDYRQQDYDNWCKAKRVYNGSYLPKDGKTLLKKGYIKLADLDHGKPKINNQPDINKLNNLPKINERYQRKSNGQIVDFHKNSTDKNNTVTYPDHYHWENKDIDEVELRKEFPNSKDFAKEKAKISMKDRYGKPCAQHSQESHLAPNDKNYPWCSKVKINVKPNITNKGVTRKLVIKKDGKSKGTTKN